MTKTWRFSVSYLDDLDYLIPEDKPRRKAPRGYGVSVDDENGFDLPDRDGDPPP